MPIQQEWTDQKIEQIVGNLLRAGVLLSAVVVLCGGVLYLIQYGHAPADYRVFRGEPPVTGSPAETPQPVPAENQRERPTMQPVPRLSPGTASSTS